MGYLSEGWYCKGDTIFKTSFFPCQIGLNTKVYGVNTLERFCSSERFWKLYITNVTQQYRLHKQDPCSVRDLRMFIVLIELCISLCICCIRKDLYPPSQPPHCICFIERHIRESVDSLCSDGTDTRINFDIWNGSELQQLYMYIYVTNQHF